MRPNLRQIPTSAGVYFFFNKAKKIIYIGKAKNLRHRLASYFVKNAELSPAKQEMVRQIADLDYTVVSNETEALLLEAGLIRKHLPPFNIILRDDKNWTYIVITDEAFPRLLTTHGRKTLKGKYFGPYTSSFAAKNIVRQLHKILPLRTCKRDLSKLPSGKVCFQYSLGRCLGPCEKYISADEYTQLIKQADHILKGHDSDMPKQLEQQMHEASANKNYEFAARLRDRIKAWKHLQLTQHIVAIKDTDQDILALVPIGQQAVFTILQVRQGQVLDRFNYLLDLPADQTIEEVWETVLAQHYSPTKDHPKEIIITQKPLALWSEIVKPSKLKTALSGNNKKLLEMAQANAYSYYQRLKQQAEIPVALYQLQQELNLKELPFRIECYDISNFQGQFSVASMVVFEGGKKKPSEYKKFNIKTVEGPNDFASLAEVLTRRQNHPEWTEPNLIIIDGGKGQLSAVMKVIKPEWKNRVVALAKKKEEIFIPGKMGSLQLPKSHPVSLLVQAIRNETHRFGITFYRQKHRKSYQNANPKS